MLAWVGDKTAQMLQQDVGLLSFGQIQIDFAKRIRRQRDGRSRHFSREWNVKLSKICP